MPNLPDCINIFTPGSFPSTIGTTPIEPIQPSLFDPSEPYDPARPTYSLDFSRHYNSPYLGAVS